MTQQCLSRQLLFEFWDEVFQIPEQCVKLECSSSVLSIHNILVQEKKRKKRKEKKEKEKRKKKEINAKNVLFSVLQ